MVFDLFKSIKNTERHALRLAAENNRLKEEKEILYRELVKREEECMAIQNERDRLAAACRLKDTIIRKGKLF